MAENNFQQQQRIVEIFEKQMDGVVLIQKPTNTDAREE